MSLPAAVRSVLTQYGRLSGRAPRSELWWWLLACVLLVLTTGVVDLVLVAVLGVPLLTLVVMLALLIPTLAVTVRRLHDSSLSGWWVLLLLALGLVSGVVLVVGLLSLLVGAVQSLDLAPDGGDGGAALSGGLALVLAAAAASLAAAVAWLVVMLRPSAPGANRYGPPRAGRGSPQPWSPPSGAAQQQQAYRAPTYDADETQPLQRPPW